MSTKQSPTPAAEFKLVYAHQARPKARHLDKRCWSSVKYREATPEEMACLPVCQHCAKRAARDEQPAKPRRQPIARNSGTTIKAAQKVEAKA